MARALVIRTTTNPMSLLSAVRLAVWSIDPDQALSEVMTVDDILDREVEQRRNQASLLGALAALALTLACVGIYGVMAYLVTQQNHEIGIRVALGAHSRDILVLILGRGATLTATGLGIGIAAALLVTRLMRSLLFGVSHLTHSRCRGGSSADVCRSRRLLLSDAPCDANRSYGGLAFRVRAHVIAAKPLRRIAIVVSKGAGRPGVGRRTAWFPGYGSRRKDEAGYEPQGCASSCAFGARKPRSYEGNRPLCRLGIFCRDVVAGFALRRAHAAQESRLTAVAVITLALGIGSSTAVFSIVDAVLLRALPYKGAERLVAVWCTEIGQPGTKIFASYRDSRNSRPTITVLKSWRL